MVVDSSLESALWAHIWDRATLLVLVTDREGTILHANRYAEELAGHRLDGRRLADMIVDFSATFDLQRAVDATTKTLLNVTTSNGPPTTLYVDVVECGASLLVVGELTYHENETLLANLITLNAEISILNRDQQKKTAELERSNELKNRFVGMAAHDLRSPLGGIHGLATILKGEALAAGDEPHAEVFAMMVESSGFMLGLIEDLLTSVSLDSGAMQLTLEPVDLNELVASSLRLNRVYADARRVNLVLDEEPVPAILVDRMKLRQVLNNLISNAVKFSAAGSVVTVSIARDDPALVISVSDRGPGIPTEEFHKLFKPFSRTTVIAPDGETSSGLGLSIARRIVDAHGGTIHVESEVGVGTTFRVRLPVPLEGELRQGGQP